MAPAASAGTAPGRAGPLTPSMAKGDPVNRAEGTEEKQKPVGAHSLFPCARDASRELAAKGRR